MNINFSGYGENAVTMLASGSLEKGMLVKITENGTVSACASGEGFCGVCLDIRDGYATVQLSGYVNMPAAKSVGVGYKKLAASATADTVTTSDAGREHLVLDCDSASAGFIL